MSGPLPRAGQRAGPNPSPATPRPKPAADAWRVVEGLRGPHDAVHMWGGTRPSALLSRRRQDREPGRAEADLEPTHEAARRLLANPFTPLPTARLPAPQWEPPPLPPCSFSCSSFSSSSFSSSSGLQSGRSAPLTVSAPPPPPAPRCSRQRPSRAACAASLRGRRAGGSRGRRGSSGAPRARGRGPAARRRRRPARHLAAAPAGEGWRRDAAAPSPWAAAGPGCAGRRLASARAASPPRPRACLFPTWFCLLSALPSPPPLLGCPFAPLYVSCRYLAETRALFAPQPTPSVSSRRKRPEGVRKLEARGPSFDGGTQPFPSQARSGQRDLPGSAVHVPLLCAGEGPRGES